jgi:signal transduction histidine kinase
MSGKTGTRPWLKNNVYHIVFAVALGALIALGLWWAVYIHRSVRSSREFHLSSLRQTQRLLAHYYEKAPPAPAPGRSDMDGRFMLGDCDSRAPASEWSMRLEREGNLCLWPEAGIVDKIEAKYRSQLIMVMGEGSLLFILVCICVFMLHRFYRSEKRFRRELERFVEVLTHRLKGPAAGLSALLETIRMGRVKGEEMGRLLDLGMAEIEQQQKIVDNILAACRDMDEPWRLSISKVEIGPILDGLLERLRRLSPGETCRVEVDLEAGGRVMADENALRIVLENILDNAFKYSRSGGMALRVTTEAAGGGMLRLHVADQGIGIRKENLDKLFQPLWRGERARSGSGLGLYISRRIVRSMGGDVTASSGGEGRGAVITVELPAASG